MIEHLLRNFVGIGFVDDELRAGRALCARLSSEGEGQSAIDREILPVDNRVADNDLVFGRVDQRIGGQETRAAVASSTLRLPGTSALAATSRRRMPLPAMLAGATGSLNSTVIGATMEALLSPAAGLVATTRGPVGAVWISTFATAAASASVAMAWPLLPSAGSVPVTVRSPGLASVAKAPALPVTLSQGSPASPDQGAGQRRSADFAD